MQRLFTTFPNSWPGVGLLLLRLTLALELVVDRPVLVDARFACGFQVLELVIGLLLVGGLWTPVAAVAQFVVDMLLVGTGEIGGAPELMGLVYLSLAALGPGAWSADAYLFGRKRLDIDV
jgi:hypothetical protein